MQGQLMHTSKMIDNQVHKYLYDTEIIYRKEVVECMIKHMHMYTYCSHSPLFTIDNTKSIINVQLLIYMHLRKSVSEVNAKIISTIPSIVHSVASTQII